VKARRAKDVSKVPLADAETHLASTIAALAAGT
jgi:hypothetical protein